jgi:hypothetical protein
VHVIKTYRLNPSDCLFCAFDHLLKKEGYAGSFMILTMDLVGQLDSDKLVEAIRRAMAAHPATAARVCVSRLRAWPYWRYDPDSVTLKYKHYDLSAEPDWQAVAERKTQEHASSASYIPGRTPMSFEHYQGPSGRHRFSMVCGHALMDVEGAQNFLAEVDRLSSDAPTPWPDRLLEDHQRIDPLAGLNLWKRWRLAKEGARTQAPGARVQEVSLLNSLPERPAVSRRIRFVHRLWPAEMARRIREIAMNTVQPGPALYGRYFAVCVLRAIYRIHAEHGRKLPYYGMMLPMRYPGIVQRPVPGNYLVSAPLCIGADRITDRRAVGQDVDRQLQAYMEGKLYAASWALSWLPAELRTWQYRWFIRRYIGRQPFATGYSFFGQIDPPIKRFVGADVTNFWGTGVVSIPPGWNPNFSRYEDKFNFGLAWPDAAFPEEVARRYAELIEEEVFAG